MIALVARVSFLYRDDAPLIIIRAIYLHLREALGLLPDALGAQDAAISRDMAPGHGAGHAGSSPAFLPSGDRVKHHRSQAST